MKINQEFSLVKEILPLHTINLAFMFAMVLLTVMVVKKSKPKESSSIRVGIDKVDSLINMVGELVITQSMLGQLGKDFEMSMMDELESLANKFLSAVQAKIRVQFALLVKLRVQDVFVGGENDKITVARNRCTSRNCPLGGVIDVVVGEVQTTDVDRPRIGIVNL